MTFLEIVVAAALAWGVLSFAAALLLAWVVRRRKAEPAASSEPEELDRYGVEFAGDTLFEDWPERGGR